ncbi:MAG: response regulator [Lachnospiraceae bacterium]|nr:response regulator [Lachnospiraceae bacterium]
MGKYKVLIIDDMDTVISRAKEIIGDRYKLAVASSVDNAMDKIKKDPPDIILCDLNMPETDGFDFFGKLKGSKYKDIPVIFVVLETSIITKTRAYEMGVVDFIQKPFVPFEMFKKIETQLKLKEIGWQFKM